MHSALHFMMWFDNFRFLIEHRQSVIFIMWPRKSVFKFCLILIIESEFSMCSPINYNKGLNFEISYAAVPTTLGNRDEITDISEIFTPDYWFPIEINVPDTFISAWQGIESAWQIASDYFSMGNIQLSSYGIDQA